MSEFGHRPKIGSIIARILSAARSVRARNSGDSDTPSVLVVKSTRFGARWRVPLVSMLAVALVSTSIWVPALRQPAHESLARARECPAARPDLAAAATAARWCGDKVEALSGRGEYETTWLNPDGTATVETSLVPQRVLRSDGSWAAPNTTLVKGADKLWRPVASVADVAFSDGGSGPFVTLRRAGHAFTLSWPAALPAPVVTGESATYAVGVGLDLVVRATPTGFSHTVVAHTRDALKKDLARALRYKIGGDARVTAGRDGLIVSAGGEVVASAGEALAWDSARDQAPLDGADSTSLAALTSTSTAPGARARVAAAAVTVAGRDLVVRADLALLDNPNLALPVFIDPSFNVGAQKYTYATANNANGVWTDNVVQAGDSTGDNMRVGMNPSSNAQIYRSFLEFPLNPAGHSLWGKQIVDANLSGKVDHTYLCWASTRPVYFYRSGAIPSSTAHKARQAWPGPSLLTYLGSVSLAANEQACSDANQAFTTPSFTADLAAAAAIGATTYTIGMTARDSAGQGENDQNRWMRFFASDFRLNVTYNAYPVVASTSMVPSAACTTGSGRPYLNTATPQLLAQVTDTEGGSVTAQFEWWPTGGSAAIGSTTVGPAASGSTLSTTVPTGVLTNGNHYSWRVRGNDGTAYGAWSNWCEFTVDTVAPSSAPTVTSSDYPAAQWAGSAGTPGNFTLSAAGVADVASYLYGLDTNPPTTSVAAPALGADEVVSLTPTTNLPHTLYVRSADRAGNVSPVTAYQFNVGSGAGAVLSPSTGDIAGARFALAAQGQSGATGVTYQWRRGEADPWTTIPVSDVTVGAGGGAVTWPQAASGGGAFAKLNWDVAATLNNAEPGPEPLSGPLQVRATFNGAGANSDAVKVTFDRDRAWAASIQSGPGEVNLLTGNLSLTESVEAGFGQGVSRTFNSRRANIVDPMFGPGWVSSVSATADPGYGNVTVTGSLVQIALPSGAVLGFALQSGTSTSATYAPQVGAEGFTLTWTSSPDRFTLTDANGTVVFFDHPSGGATGLYTPTAVIPAASNDKATISWELVPGSTTTARPTRVLAAVPSGVTCTTLTAGCRALAFTFASTTTATGTTPSTWGDYANRVSRVSFTAWDPDASPPAMRTVDIAVFLYDDGGHLRAARDPRLDYTDGSGSHNVQTTYAYNADGTLASMTPPGEEPWTFTYTTVPGDTGTGRLAAVSRSALTAGTATSTVVYQVPTSGSVAPYDLSASQTVRWGQTEAPTDAVAFFPPTQIPTGDQAAGTLPGSYEHATVAYLDANGRVVNTAGPGGGIATTWYDLFGNTVSSLTPGNRARALANSISDSPADEAALAAGWSTTNTYSADGKRLLETLGPVHDVNLASAQLVAGRSHVVYSYDEGAPAGETPDRVTTTTASVRYIGAGGSPVDADARTTTTAYNWDLRLPTAQTVDPSGLSLTTRWTYRSDGTVNQVTTPEGGTATNTPSTRQTTFYRAGTGSGFADCDNHPAWAGLVCRTDPGGQASSGPEQPAVLMTYDLYGELRSTVEKTSAATLRTTTITHDNAGRPVDVSASATIGTAISTTRTVYDPKTGQAVRTGSLDGTGAVTDEVVRTYDELGRLTSYADAEGNVTTLTYDIASRLQTFHDGKATQTYSYDVAGRPEEVVDSGAGTMTASYDLDGNVIRQTWPENLIVESTYDTSGSLVGLRYTQTGCGQADCTLYQDTVTANAHDEWASHLSSLSAQAFGYDAASRLTTVRDTLSGACTTRVYAFAGASGAGGNRTSLTTYGPNQNGTCQTATVADTRSYGYDEADRITTTVYDALGRTTSTPAGDTLAPSNGATTMTYYANDMVRTIAQGGRTTTYTLDVIANRTRSWSDDGSGTAVTRTNHFSDDTDSPAWTNEGDGTWTRAVAGLAGLAALQVGPVSGNLTWLVTNLHGDIVAGVVAGATGLAFVSEQTEYGQPRNAADVGARRYGWLGSAQRAADTPGGLMLMGARVYSPATGRFLSTDPIAGGNANAYEYAHANPVMRADTSGAVDCHVANVKVRTWNYWGTRTMGGFRYDFDAWCYLNNWELAFVTVGAIGASIGAAVLASVGGPVGVTIASLALRVIAKILWNIVKDYYIGCAFNWSGATFYGHIQLWRQLRGNYSWGYPSNISMACGRGNQMRRK